MTDDFPSRELALLSADQFNNGLDGHICRPPTQVFRQKDDFSLSMSSGCLSNDLSQITVSQISHDPAPLCGPGFSLQKSK